MAAIGHVGARWFRCGIATVATAFAYACAASSTQIVSIPQQGLRPAARVDQIDNYRTAAATVTSIVHRDLGFEAFPVTFRFFKDRDTFERALLQSGYDADLAHATATTMAAVGGYRNVLVNEHSLSGLRWSERVALIAHELGHSLQYEMGGGRRGSSDQWLREGFAEWLSIRVCERLDVGSMNSVLQNRRRILLSAGRSKTPRLDALVTFPQWVKVGQRQGTAAYALAFVAVDFLLERHGADAVLGYFKRFAVSQDREGNFRTAFGEELGSFQDALDKRVWGR